MDLETMLSPGSPEWWLLVGVVGFGRGCDLGSTYVATPGLLLEANPIARRLGWRLGVVVNFALVLLAASWPLLAISLTTTSLLIAARNLQSAWLMRSMGEGGYRRWMRSRLDAGGRGLAWACFLGEALLFAVVGGALLWFGRWQLVPFAIGLGIASHAAAVGVFTSLALWRGRDGDVAPN